MTKRENKEMVGTIEPLSFLPGFDTPEIKEYQDMLFRFVNVTNIIGFLYEAKRSTRLTEKEIQSLDFVLSDFNRVESYLAERLGLNL